MPSTPQSAYEILQALDPRGGDTTLFVVHRRLAGRMAQYRVSKVDVENRLRIQLQTIVRDAVTAISEIEDYTFLTDDQDGRALTLPIQETDFVHIRDFLEATPDIPRATDTDDLVGAWGYVVRIDSGGQVLFGFRKLTTFWSTKKVRGVMNLIFRDEVLIDVSDQPVFKIDAKLDFLSVDETVFVLDKTNFESALNYRVAMETHRDAVVDDLAALNLFTDVRPIRNAVGNNIRLLRKIASVHQRGYYRDPAFMNRLRELNDEEKWGLIIVDDQIVATSENVALILTLLGNDRLASQINAEVFDVTVKRKVVSA